MSNDPVTVGVEHNARGWQVTLPDHARRVACETFDDARRIAYLCAAHTRPCELIVHDSCHRRLHHELIDAHSPPEKEKIAIRPTAG